MENVKLDIKGCCVTREAFNYTDRLKDDIIFDIDNYYFQKPVKVIMSDPIYDKSLLDELQNELTNKLVFDFITKGMRRSFDKQFFDNPNGDKYLLIDFVDERNSVVEIEQLVPFNSSYIELASKTEDIIASKNLNIIKEISDDELLSLVDQYLNKCFEVYGKDKVIINRAFAAYETMVDGVKLPLSALAKDYYSDVTQRSYAYVSMNKVNTKLIKIYDYIAENFDNIQYIDLDYSKYYCPDTHFFAYGPMHYSDNFYYDFMDELSDIIKKRKIDFGDDTIYQKNVQMINKYLMLEQMSKGLTKYLNPELMTAQIDHLPFNNNLAIDFSDESYLCSLDLTGDECYNRGYLFKYGDRLSLLWKYRKDLNRTELYYRCGDKDLLLAHITDEIVYFNTDCEQLVVKNIENNLNRKITMLKYGNIMIKIAEATNGIMPIIAYQNNELLFRVDLQHQLINKVLYCENKQKHTELRFDKFINFGKVGTKINYTNDEINRVVHYNSDGTIRYLKQYSENTAVTELYYNQKIVKKIEESDGHRDKIIDYRRGSGTVRKITYLKDELPVQIDRYDENGNKK